MDQRVEDKTMRQLLPKKGGAFREHTGLPTGKCQLTSDVCQLCCLVSWLGFCIKWTHSLQTPRFFQKKDLTVCNLQCYYIHLSFYRAFQECLLGAKGRVLKSKWWTKQKLHFWKAHSKLGERRTQKYHHTLWFPSMPSSRSIGLDKVAQEKGNIQHPGTHGQPNHLTSI